MKTTVDTYKQDKYYPKIVRSFDRQLANGIIVEPIQVYIDLSVLDPKKVQDWRFGRVQNLEGAITCNLSKCSRILRILRFHAHDLNMVPRFTDYRRWGKGKKHIKLQFSRSGNAKIERDYATCFKWNRRVSYAEWKNEAKPEVKSSTSRPAED